MEQRIGDVDFLIAIRAAVDNRRDKFFRVGCRKTAALRSRPLHGGADGVALLQIEVIPHADLIAIAHHRNAGQGKEYRVAERQPLQIAVEHRGQATADPALVDVHLVVRGEGIEDKLFVFLADALQIQLVVIAQPVGKTA